LPESTPATSAHQEIQSADFVHAATRPTPFKERRSEHVAVTGRRRFATVLTEGTSSTSAPVVVLEEADEIDSDSVSSGTLKLILFILSA